MIKAIIFDCFGVVVADPMKAAYASLGGDHEADKEFLRDITLKGHKGEIPSTIPHIAKRLGVSEDVWKEKISKDREINYELLEYVTELKKSYKTGMLSNVSSLGVERFISHKELNKYFEVVIESYVIGFAKPEARAYEIAADKLGVRLDECVFTDDRVDYIEGAQHVGMKTILFKDTEQFKQDLEKLLRH